jgi:hypothetical protein
VANGQDLTVANALLKNVYTNGTNEQINNDTPALGQIKSSAANITTVGGAGVRFSVHFGRNHGIGARNELETLPAAGQQLYAQGNTGLKSLYGTIQVTGQLMNQAKSDYQSFVNAVDEEVTRIKTDLAKDQNRQVYGDGTGTLAKVLTGGTASAAIVFDDTRYISPGMRVDLLQGTTLGNAVPTVRNPTANRFLQVTLVDRATNTVTFDQAVATFTTGDVIVRSGGTTNSWKKEWTGLGAIINNTGTLFGIDSSVYPDWKAVVKTGVGTLTELKMNQVVQDIREKGSKPTRILTTPGVYNAYWSALQSMRQYVNKTDLEGGLGSLAFSTPYGNIPILTDFDCPGGTAWFPNESEIKINTNVGWEWIDEQGSMWQKIPGVDGFIAEMRNYSELTTTRRNAHGVLKGVTEVTG